MNGRYKYVFPLMFQQLMPITVQIDKIFCDIYLIKASFGIYEREKCLQQSYL